MFSVTECRLGLLVNLILIGTKGEKRRFPVQKGEDIVKYGDDRNCFSNVLQSVCACVSKAT